jgi:hypothetical protein
MTSRAERHRNPQDPKPEPTVAGVLESVRQALDTTELALTDLLSNEPPRRMAGLKNIAVWGRAVTNALQKLRTPVGAAFDEWYKPREEEMRDDELMTYFYRLRNQVLKATETPDVDTRLYIGELTGEQLQELMRDPPPNAKGFFIGGELGGAGWDVELPDGRIGQHYVTLPGYLMLGTTLHLPQGPTTHMGEPLADTSLEVLAKHYVEYLRRIVREAGETFSG